MTSMIGDSQIVQNALANSWWKGEEYSNNSTAQFTLAEEILQSVPFCGDENVLDLGCGDGQVTDLIAQKYLLHGKIIGLDLSSSMLQTAKAKYQQQDRVEFRWGDAQYFAYEEYFDLIFSFSALHWAPDQYAVWRNIKQHLKVGGKAFISLNPAPYDPDLSQAIAKTIRKEHWSQYFIGFQEIAVMPEMTIEQYQNIVLQQGLRVEECTKSTRHLFFENQSQLHGSIRSWLPHVAQVPDVKKDFFVKEIVDKYLQLTHQDGHQTVRLGYCNFMVKAIRS